MNAPVGVIELGSGNTKLVVARATGLVRRSVPLALAKQVDSAGVVTAEGLDQLRSGLGPLVAEAAGHGVENLAVVGTAAVRRIKNIEPLAALVEESCGVALEVLSGDREAALGLAAVARSTAAPGATIDIGAGSTEFAAANPKQPGNPITFSFPLGGVPVTATYLHSDPPLPSELSAALSVIELYFTDLEREAPLLAEAIGRGPVIGLGVMRTIARVEIGIADLDRSVEGEVLARAAVEEVFRTLATESREDRAFNPGLPPEQVVDIIGALCVLVEFMRHFGVDEVVVTESGVADGRAAELLAEGSLAEDSPTAAE